MEVSSLNKMKKAGIFVCFIRFMLAEQILFHGRFPIGAIFDTDDVYTKTGFSYAITSFSEKKAKHYGFTTMMEVIDVSNSFQLVKNICSHMSNGVFVLLGTRSFLSKDIIDSYSLNFHMPYITNSVIHYKQSRTDYEIFMRPLMTLPIYSMINHYGWREVHYIYDSDAGLMRIQALLKLFKDEVKLLSSRRLLNINKAHEDLRKLDLSNKKSKEKKIILDLSTEAAYMTLLNQIREVGMNKYGYSYLIGSLDILNLDMSRFTHGGVNITGFQMVDYNSKKVQKFMKKWNNLSPKVWDGADRRVSIDAALAYDTVTVLDKTFTSMLRNDSDVFRATFRRAEIYNNNLTKGIPCKESIPWMHGNGIMTYLKELNFTGITGRIAFHDNGTRSDFVLGVYNVGLNAGPTKTGEWRESNGFMPLLVNETIPQKTDGTYVKEYIVTSIFEKPFLQLKEDYEDRIGNDRYEGYAVDLIELVAEKCNGLKYKISPNKDGVYGSKNDDSDDWSGMIGELIQKKADLAVAPLTITMERETAVDFSKPFMNSGISMMLKKPQIQKPGVFSFMKPFSIPLWMCIIIGYISVSSGMFIVSRFSPAEWHRKKLRMDKGKVNKFTLQSSLWFTMGALMLQGNDTCPRSAAGRIIGGTWWFAVLIVISSYTANLAAFLTIEKLLTPIESADELANQNTISYGTLDSGSTQHFFKTSNVSTYRKMWNYMNTAYPSAFVKHTEDGVERVRNMKGKYAFLLESVYNEYFNNREPCDTMQVGPPLITKGYGIATPKFSELRDDISIAVLQLTEDGSLIKLKKKWWIDKGECGEQGSSQGSKKKSLSLSNVAGAFFILIGGLVFAIVIGVTDFLRLKSKGRTTGFFLIGADLTSSVVSNYSECTENGPSTDSHKPKQPPKGILTNSNNWTSPEVQQNIYNHNCKNEVRATSLL